jgi:hypothetical protein
MTIWRMRIACWIPKATNTNTHTEYVILIAFALQQWLRERGPLLRHASYVIRTLLSVLDCRKAASSEAQFT